MNRKSHRCIVIGKGSLLIRCTEILLAAEFEVLALVSNDAQVQNWGRTTGVNCLSSASELVEQVSEPFDYLFSIVNDHILPNELLRRPKKLAINYHDGPLPTYAGTHATSWALFNGETTHGVTWHVITDTVDAGDVLVQKSVVIDKSDTALTLNTKCFEAAINSFSELVESLVNGNISQTPQDLNHRTFFGRFKRPRGGGLIDWHESATKVTNTVRALDFGNHPNPLGTAKLAIGDQFFRVLKCEGLESESKSAFGTINRIDFDSLTVSALDNEVRISQISKLNGEQISISDLMSTCGLTVGSRLTILNAEKPKRIDELIESISRHEDYWTQSIQEAETISPPYSASDVSEVPNTFKQCRIPVPPEFLRYLNELGVQGQHHKYLIGAFVAMLARLSSVSCFHIGYSGADVRTEIEGLEQLFADYVPFRVSVAEHAKFEDFALSVFDEIDLVTRHKTYIRDVFARYPQLRASHSSSGEFKTPIVIASVHGDSAFEPREKTEIAFVVSESEPECCFTYESSRFRFESINRLTDHFRIFLSGIATDPSCSIAYLPLISEAERNQLLIEVNHLDLAAPENEPGERNRYDSISEFFEAQVSLDPTATALVFGDEQLSYRRLNQRANQVARFLRGNGVGSDVLVGICLERSVEMIVGILGVLKAGGAYLPLDPAYPKERINYMLSDSRAKVLLTNEPHVDTFDEFEGVVVSFDADGKRIARENGQDLPASMVPRRPNDLAYVIYTSGSTGNPKGVAIEHRNTLALLDWAMSVYGREQLKGTLASTSICFDLSVFEIFLPLACGGTIVLVENILHLPAVSHKNDVTLINTVPSAISELLRRKEIPPSVRTVNLAGEPLKSSLVERIYAIGTVDKVYDLYGPTEDTTYSTFKLRDLSRATIGHAIKGTQVYILDRHLQPVPFGIAGELYLGGAGLARGYLNRPELTEEKFIKNPFEDAPCARIYKTGDLARFLENGEIEYLGRIDNQVKIRGFRIELDEIETKLGEHPGIREVVVVARENLDGDKRLVAYFVTNDGESIERNELRGYLAELLPDFMVPSAFVELAEIPLTPNGKIDRKALPKPSASVAKADNKVLSGRDAIEQRLVEIWERLLDISSIGVQDNFFELGGDSLKAVRMFGELEKTFGKNIPLATLFGAGTIEALGQILRMDGWAEPESCLVPIQPAGTKPTFFCVHAKGGNVLFYRDLAKHLGTDQPFYGIQARRLGGRQIGHSTVEEMADFYIKEIKEFQPDGPFFLGGSSFGGLAAFEIAKRLEDRGEQVGLVALFDTGTPDYPQPLPNVSVVKMKVNSLLLRIRHHWELLRAIDARHKAAYIFEKLAKTKLYYQRKIVGTYKKVVRGIYREFDKASPLPAKYIQIEDQIRRAGQIYKPGVYKGKLTLFRASVQPYGIQPDASLGWDRHIEREIEIHEIPGHHGSIVTEPYVSVLARKLAECLSTAQLNGGVSRAAVSSEIGESGQRQY